MISFPLCIQPELGLLGHMAVLFLISGGTSILFSIVTIPVYIPTDSVQGFLFLQILTSICYLFSFCNRHLNRCEVISHYGFDVQFPDD